MNVRYMSFNFNKVLVVKFSSYFQDNGKSKVKWENFPNQILPRYDYQMSMWAVRDGGAGDISLNSLCISHLSEQP